MGESLWFPTAPWRAGGPVKWYRDVSHQKTLVIDLNVIFIFHIHVHIYIYIYTDDCICFISIDCRFPRLPMAKKHITPFSHWASIGFHISGARRGPRTLGLEAHRRALLGGTPSPCAGRVSGRSGWCVIWRPKNGSSDGPVTDINSC